MAIKEFKYKGKTLEELKSMEIKELAEILPARERRNLLRGLSHEQKALLDKVRKTLTGKRKKIIKTHNRDMVILPEMVGLVIHVHSGNKFEPVRVSEEMIGHRLGEFALTRRSIKHSAPGIGATRSSAGAAAKK